MTFKSKSRSLGVQQNVLVCLGSHNATIVVVDLERLATLEAYELVEDAYVYQVGSSILAIRRHNEIASTSRPKGTDSALSTTVLEQGTFYSTEEYYDSLLRESKFQSAIDLCVAEHSLHSLEVMEPLLTELARKDEATRTEVLQSKTYAELVDIVTKVAAAGLRWVAGTR